ncbi:MAG: YhdP family phospholipid transporter, partial [Tepidimonas sp.]|uniref:YhdP family phospholipid transporter n=1 Tax=Tepidimonas sp. TaxID=2002775 RepID=UPI004054D7EB
SDRLDLGVVQRLARVLPLCESINRWAASTQPAGVAEGLAVRWSAASQPGARERWAAQGRVRGLALRPGPLPSVAAGQIAFGRPGLEGVDAEFAADERGGRATLALRGGSLTFPGVFEDPRLAFDELSAEARWTIDGPAITLEISRLTFANADAAGSGTVRWRTADPARSPARDRYPGIMTLDVRLTRADGARVARYLPVTVGADARQYLRAAVRTGRVGSASFRVDGDLWDFPFADAQQGTFEVRAQLQDVALDYAPQHLLPPGSAAWPALERVHGELRIERQRLQIGQASGSVAGQPALRALQVQAVIPDYMADEPQLQVSGLIRGGGDEALRFVAASPLREFTGGVLDTVRATGPLDVALELRMPLNHTERTQVRGQVRFAGNDLQMRPDVPLLQGVRGMLDFTERGFEVGQASARALGGELRFSGGMTRRDGAAVVRFQGQGSVSAAGLAASREWGWASWLGQHAQGTTRYTLGLAFGPDGMDLQFDSDLRGLALSLPAPLTKTADALWRVAVAIDTRARPDAAADLMRDRLRVTVEPGSEGVPLRAEYERDHAGSRTA